MPQTKTKRPAVRNVAELLDRLGGVPAWRVCLDPPPGTATGRHLIRARGTFGGTCELLDRTLVEKPRDHVKAYIAAELAAHLGNYLATNDLGILYGSRGWVRFRPGVVRSPDLSFTPWSRMSGRYVPLDPIGKEVPELAIDVVGRDNTPGEFRRKREDYFPAGVRLAWVIDPRKQSAAVHTAPDKKIALDETGTLDGGDVLPGFRLPLAKLFGRLEKPTGKPKKVKKK